MPLSNLIFTPGQVPDYASMGFKAASLAPDLQAKFIAGQRAAQEQQMNQLKYQQEKQKADLFAAIAPELQQYKLAELRARMAQMNGMAVPTNYNPGLPGVRVVQPVQPAADPRAVDRSLFPGFTNTPVPANNGAQPANIPGIQYQNAPSIDQPFSLQLGAGAPPMGFQPTSDIMNYSGDASGFDDTGEYYS